VRLICENCDHGYATWLRNCHNCGTSCTFAHTSDVESECDTECYVDYWLCKFSTGEEFEMYEGKPLDIPELRRVLSLYTIFTFNGIGYDLPMISIALTGATCRELKYASDLMIVHKYRSWDVLRNFNATLVKVDHVDIMNVLPGDGGLKSYGAKMFMPTLQDLPIDPRDSIHWYDRPLMRKYCGNDLDTTAEAKRWMKESLQLRYRMSNEYKIDLRSKSNAQIAEAVVKKLIGGDLEPQHIPPGSTFLYQCPEWITFKNINHVKTILATDPFTIHIDGSPKMPIRLQELLVRIGQSAYNLGAGGLHSTESRISHVATDAITISDHDVSSYYPSIIDKLGLFPPSLGHEFLRIYRSWKTERLAVKSQKTDESRYLSDSLKLFLNSIFGKLGSMFSIFYAPEELIQVTVTGQLALLMLIETLESHGISVISANTDGIVIKCHVSKHTLRDLLIIEWTHKTGFQMEVSNYSGLYSRDVNSYIAIKTNGDVKLKGAFAPPLPTASNWPAPSGQICVDACVAWLKHKTPIEQTIRECQDIKQFMYVRTVKGGGRYYEREVYPLRRDKTPSKKYQRSVEERFSDLGWIYDQIVTWSRSSGTYLGKVVRWYYGNNANSSIRYDGSFNLVPKTEGCVAAMELPIRMPDDLNYAWYVKEALSILNDIGVIYEQ